MTNNIIYITHINLKYIYFMTRNDHLKGLFGLFIGKGLSCKEKIRKEEFHCV